jgi:hypothetical protein
MCDESRKHGVFSLMALHVQSDDSHPARSFRAYTTPMLTERRMNGTDFTDQEKLAASACLSFEARGKLM